MGLEHFLLQNRVSRISSEVGSYLHVETVHFPVLFQDHCPQYANIEFDDSKGGWGCLDLDTLSLIIPRNISEGLLGDKIIFHELVHGYHRILCQQPEVSTDLAMNLNVLLAFDFVSEYLARLLTNVYYGEAKGGKGVFQLKSDSKSILFSSIGPNGTQLSVQAELTSRAGFLYMFAALLGSGYVPHINDVSIGRDDNKALLIEIAPLKDRDLNETLLSYVKMDYHLLAQNLVGPESKIGKAFVNN